MSAKLILALAASLPFLTLTLHAAESPDLWRDPSQPIEARVKDLISKMTLVEKSSQLLANPPAIPRLGIPAYSHRNECLHGVANGVSTVFPQAIGMAATFDTPLIKIEADAIATEGRAKHNDYVAKHDGSTAEHNGLNFYSPNINIFRDPRWGRGQETYGEDPFLTAQMGIAFVTGLQGDDPAHPKTIACAKHFAVHSGPEKERHHINMTPPERDLYETYLPAFEALVKEAHVGSAMGAYSALDGKPCCADEWLLTDLLRKQWGFTGVVFSDGGAIGDIWAEHHFVKGPVEAAAAAVNAGCDVSSGGMGDYKPLQPNTLQTPKGPGHANADIKGGAAFTAIPEAVHNGLLSEAAVNTALTRELTLRFKLGLFDPPGTSPFDKIDISRNNTPEHRALSLKVARESMVLLKNDGILPLDKSKYKTIAVIGPNADDEKMQNGNYAGRSSKTVTILDGIKNAVGNDAKIIYEQGSRRANRKDASDPDKAQMADKALAAAKDADLVIFVSGIDAGLGHEEGPTRIDVYQGFSRGDRTRIELPHIQEDLIKALHAIGKPIILVNCSGSAMAIPWEKVNLPAILQAWYPGEEGGTAVADVLFGKCNPAGRLPITFYASTKDLPDFTDYSMKNRTYKYFSGKPLYPFGFGLSYTTFDYTDPKSELTSGSINLSFTIKNTGPSDGDEVPQIYFRHIDSKFAQPTLALCAFKRIHLNKNELQTISLKIPINRFRYYDQTKKRYAIEPGAYELLIGPCSADAKLKVPVTLK